MSDESTLRTAFERFDSDGNGYIDESEFAALVKSLGVDFSAEKLRVAFLAIDVNGNERIEFGEFRAWWTKYQGARPATAS
jgi:Ca2+-binding EF-hand superfamily protein